MKTSGVNITQNNVADRRRLVENRKVIQNGKRKSRTGRINTGIHTNIEIKRGKVILIGWDKIQIQIQIQTQIHIGMNIRATATQAGMPVSAVRWKSEIRIAAQERFLGAHEGAQIAVQGQSQHQPGGNSGDNAAS